MSDLSLVKASIDGLLDGIADVAAIVKKKESVLQSGVDLVQSLLNDEDFKAQASKVMAGGLAGLLAQLKSMGDISSDLELAISELPNIEKLISALKA